MALVHDCYHSDAIFKRKFSREEMIKVEYVVDYINAKVMQNYYLGRVKLQFPIWITH